MRMRSLTLTCTEHPARGLSAFLYPRKDQEADLAARFPVQQYEARHTAPGIVSKICPGVPGPRIECANEPNGQ